MRLTILAAGAMIASLVLFSETVGATEVDCDSGETISDALNRPGKTISIKGTCVEDVVVKKDDTTLRGDDTWGGTIQGSVLIDGFRRVTIENLHLSNSTTDAIAVVNGAFATIIDNEITNYTDAGIRVELSSLAILKGNIVSGGVNGIIVARGSDLRSQGGNTLSNSSAESVFVNQASSFRAGVGTERDSFSNNAVEAVLSVKEVSSIDVRNADIICAGACESFTAVVVTGGGTFRTRNDVLIDGNVFVRAGSGVRLDDTIVDGQLICAAGSYGFGNASSVDCPG